MPKRQHTVFTSLLRTFSITVSLGLILVGILILFAVNKSFDNLVASKHEMILELFSENIRYEILTGSHLSIREKCNLLIKKEAIDNIIISNIRGEVIYESLPETAEVSRTSKFVVERTVYFDDEKTQPAAMVSMRFNTGIIRGLYYRIMGVSLFVLMTIAAIAFLMLKRVAHRISAPLHTLSQTAESGNLEDLSLLDQPNIKGDLSEVVILTSSIRKLAQQTLQSNQYRIETKKAEAVYQVAQQIAHDIRAPVAALDLLAGTLVDIPEEKRVLIRNASQRIKDIANNLLGRNIHQAQHDERPNQAMRRTWLISSIIESIVSEKRGQFRTKTGIRIEAKLDEKSYGLFAKVSAVELKRVISNLVNNSVEAMTDEGVIEIGLFQHNNSTLCLYVKDDGTGIPPDILGKLGQKGVTYGKGGTDSGLGLGVYHAKVAAESWGGELKIESTEGQGTQISLLLPKESPPSWFVPRLEVAPDSRIVTLDDDPTIHQIWRERFHALRNGGGNRIKLDNLSTPDAIRTWVEKNDTHNALFLCDYELLNFKETGLDLIEELNLQDQAILVTSHFEEEVVLMNCARLGVKCIPKSLASLVPIGLRPQS